MQILLLADTCIKDRAIPQCGASLQRQPVAQTPDLLFGTAAWPLQLVLPGPEP